MEKPKKDKKPSLKVTEITMQEIWAASKPSVHKNKKKYSRKDKKDFGENE